MNLFRPKSILGGAKSIAAALALSVVSAGVAQAAPAEDYGISYTWFEGGWSRINDRTGGGDFDVDGGYLRGSFALGDVFYLLGGYSRHQDSASASNSTTTVKFKTQWSQAELGIGARIPLADRLDAIGELTALYLNYDYSVRINGQKVNAKYDEHDYGAKAMIGLRAKPFEMLDVWGKVGVFKMQDGDSSTFPVRKSALANFGVQLHLTPNIGLVAEADFYKKDVRYYRAGVRASF